eukprot:6214718-Pleurochrysis_carterae.AAC.4
MVFIIRGSEPARRGNQTLGTGQVRITHSPGHHSHPDKDKTERSAKLAKENTYLRTTWYVASQTCERTRAMAEPASEQASAMFSPPATHLSQSAGRRERIEKRWTEGRRVGAGRGCQTPLPRASRFHRVHPPNRPGGFVRHVCSAPPSTQTTQSTSGADRGRAPMAARHRGPAQSQKG